ncbi:MAG: enolase C-terminal domain-like protein, partial [Candidatus Omnitrophota bacterium]|nr:enolase C-terminal domain-like protein [Candidatus Omnitrophota bacterium]
MIVTEFIAYRYSLKLKRPVLVKGTKAATRDGIILQIKNADGTSGFGEISPLPGFSRETLIQAEHQLSQVKEEFLTREIPHGLTHLNGHFHNWFKSLALSPSVRFGAEMAILNLLANAKKVPLGQVIHEHHQPVGHVALCGLLQGSLEQVVEQAQTLLGLGYRSMKLKVGSQDIHEDADKVAAVNKITRDKVLLRLDANQGWDFEEALKFGK